MMKTIEEKARKYATLESGFVVYSDFKAYMSGAAAALVDQWRTVKADGYPEDNRSVVVAYRLIDGDVMYGVANRHDGAWYIGDMQVRQPEVFAWMPIPEIVDNSKSAPDGEPHGNRAAQGMLF